MKKRKHSFLSNGKTEEYTIVEIHENEAVIIKDS